MKQLPIYSTWKDIVNNAKDASYFKKEYNKLKENFDKRIGQKDEIIVQLGDKKDRLQDFYDRFLFVLSISKIRNEESALDVALKPYDWDTRWAIMQDLYNLQNASYKEIILQNGDKGYGYYSSKEEGSVYLGDEFDRDQLEALYPDANFTREVSPRDVSRSGRSR